MFGSVQNVNKGRDWSRRAAQARLDQWRTLLTFCTEALASVYIEQLMYVYFMMIAVII